MSDERERHHDQQAALRALEVLELPAEPHEVARRQLDVAPDPLPHLVHEAAEVAPAHVGLDDEPPLRPTRAGSWSGPETSRIVASRPSGTRSPLGVRTRIARELRGIVAVLVPAAAPRGRTAARPRGPAR